MDLCPPTLALFATILPMCKHRKSWNENFLVHFVAKIFPLKDSSPLQATIRNQFVLFTFIKRATFVESLSSPFPSSTSGLFLLLNRGKIEANSSFYNYYNNRAVISSRLQKHVIRKTATAYTKLLHRGEIQARKFSQFPYCFAPTVALGMRRSCLKLSEAVLRPDWTRRELLNDFPAKVLYCSKTELPCSRKNCIVVNLNFRLMQIGYARRASRAFASR